MYYYDVNSLYPHAALNSMPGLDCEFEGDMVVKFDTNTDLFGFYYCNIKSKDGYYGLLPVRDDDNSIVMPNGE